MDTELLVPKSEEKDTNDTKKISKKRKQRTTIDWIKINDFPDNDSVMNYIKHEDTWSYQTQRTDADGSIIVRYRCNKVTYRGPQCSAVIKIIYNTTNDITLYRSASDHNHNEILSKSKPKVLNNIKEEITSMFLQNNRIKPKKIIETLKEKQVATPKPQQITHILHKLKTKHTSSQNISTPKKSRIKQIESPKNEISFDYDNISEIVNENDNETTAIENDNTDNKPMRKKRHLVDWIKIKSFTDNETVMNYIKEEETWSYQTRCTDSDRNMIVRYRCNKVKSRGPQCAAVLRLIYNSTSTEIAVYRSSTNHTHNNILNGKPKFLKCTKDEITKLFMENNNIRPKRVLEILKTNHVPLPSHRQVVNYLNQLRIKNFSQTSISLSELEKLLTEHSKIPENDYESFVVDYEIDGDNDTFRFFISTKMMFKNALRTEHIHADGTSKLLWQGFPVFVLGTTDKQLLFHCLGISVCSNETVTDFIFTFNALKKGINNICEKDYKPKVLIADESETVKDAFQEVFGCDTVIVMCWSHMHKNIIKNLQNVEDKSLKKEILKDIECLQMSKNFMYFLEARNLFIEKWENVFPYFIDYFKENWVNQNSNWYEAACNYVPSTNNALENFIKDIKHVLRERLPLTLFLTEALNYLSSYSNKSVVFCDQPNISLEIWSRAYNWVKLNKIIVSNNLDSSDLVHFQIPGNNLTDIKYCRETFESFDEFKQVNIECYNVLLPTSNDYLKGECDCEEFFKCFICEHIVGLAIRLGIVNPPKNVINVSLNKKGRVSMKRKALICK